VFKFCNQPLEKCVAKKGKSLLVRIGCIKSDVLPTNCENVELNENTLQNFKRRDPRFATEISNAFKLQNEIKIFSNHTFL
jgi:hypothetical protein